MNQQIVEAVKAYQSKYRNPSLPEFEISDSYDLKKDWPDIWPHAERAGCYVILGASEEILYVGKASLGSAIGKRLSDHFVYGPNKECLPKYEWKTQPCCVAAIAVHDAIEAPSLEEYLIRELRPAENTIGHRGSTE